MRDRPEPSTVASAALMAACVVPHEQLGAETLRRLIEEFVTRDGTDYGHGEWTLEQKVAEVMQQLQRGDVVIVFDGEAGSATIVQAERLAAATRGSRPSTKSPMR